MATEKHTPTTESPTPLKDGKSPNPQNTRTQEQEIERTHRMINAFDRAFDREVKELDSLASTPMKRYEPISELAQEVKKLPPERQMKGAPYFRVMEYWQKNCPRLLEDLGSEAEAAALLRQDQYHQRFNQLLDQGENPFFAHQIADSETIYQPTAEVDQEWVNSPPLYPLTSTTESPMPSKVAKSPRQLNTLTPEEIAERKSRMINAFDKAFDQRVRELDNLKEQARRK